MAILQNTPNAVVFHSRAMRYLLFLSLLFVTPVWADEPAGTRVSLSAEAEAMAPNDEVVVNFHIVAEGPLAKPLRQEVNRISQAGKTQKGAAKCGPFLHRYSG